jgi:XapX domain-containing protein
MLKLLIGVLVAFGIGFGCKWFDIPAPAPPMLQGAVLVVAMTFGYTAAGWLRDPPTPASPATATAAASAAGPVDGPSASGPRG